MAFKGLTANKTDNATKTRGAKVAIRRKVIEAIGKDAFVFDAFAGRGGMYRAVWKNAAGYVGCDLRWFPDGRSAYVADNLRVLRAIPLDPFAIFDLDAYGSPWHQALIIAARRRVKTGEKIGIVITEGSGLSLKFGGLPRALQILTGVASRPAGLNRAAASLLDRAIMGTAERMGCKVVKRWEAQGKTGASMRYIGLILEGIDQAASSNSAT